MTTEQPRDPNSRDGWVALEEQRLVVHDPIGEGRFATIFPERSVRLWLNGELIKETTVVSEADEARAELAPDQDRFFELILDPEHMSVTLKLTSHPHRIPDMVELIEQHPARLRAAYSPNAASRSTPAKQAIVEELAQLGVVYGLDEAAIDQELTELTYGPIVIARGQLADPGQPGEWVWRVGEQGLVEAGQVLAIRQGGSPVQPQIKVTGERLAIYPELAEEGGYLAGTGTRMMAGGRLVSTVSGRARLTAMGQGTRVDVGAFQIIQGNLTQDISVPGDLLISGSLKGATVVAGGEVLVVGNVEDARVQAGAIHVKGQVQRGQLSTLAAASVHAPLRGELGFVHRRFEEFRDMAATNKPVPDGDYRALATMVRAIREKAQELRISHEGLNGLFVELISGFRAAAEGGGLHLVALERLCKLMEEFLAADTGNGGVTAGSILVSTVWSAGDIRFEEKCVSSSLLCGGAVAAPPESVCAQSEILAAEQVTLGVITGMHGSPGVVVRSKRLEAEEIKAGTAFEFGQERTDFRVDQMRVIAGVNSKGQVGYRHRD